MAIELIRLRTGRGALVPLRALHDGARWVVVASGPSPAWARYLLISGGGELVTPGGEVVRCGAVPVIEPDQIQRVVAAFRDALGPVRWLQTLPPRPRIVELDPAREVRPRSSEERLRLEFDLAAGSYKDRVAARPVESYQKSVTRQRLMDRFRGFDRLLEIGPGPGLETLSLLRSGHRVTAVDISEAMLRALRREADSAGLAARLETRVGSLGRLEEAIGYNMPGTFDGAYSTFGPFNLEANFDGPRRTLARHLRSGASLVFTSLNRPGYLPVVWELARGRMTQARERRCRTSTTTDTVFPLDLHRRTPSEWDELLRPEFRRTRTEAVSVLAPPFDGTHAAALLGPRGRAALRRTDRWLCRRELLAASADSVLLSYERG